MGKDYYKILGIDKNASKEEIKKAYKTLAKKYHPDISKEKDAEVKFKEINEAAGVLLDDQKKSNYDNYGSETGPSGFGGFGGSSSGGFNPNDFGINLDDIFEQFGFRGFSESSSYKKQRKRSNQDSAIYEKLEITLDEVYFGVTKIIKVNRNIKCSDCNGKGAKNSSDIETCPVCHGSGVVIETQRSILGSIRTQRVCYNCSGTGEIIKNPCVTCNGKGYNNKKEELEVKIPAGIEEGITLRISEKGNYDPHSDSYGDLFVKVYIKKNKTFEIDGYDLYMNLDINFVQAILGDEIEFDHFEKRLSIKIPEGTQPNSILRLKGKGLPYLNYDSYGDLYVKVNIILPKKTSSEQKKILMDFAKTMKDKGLFDRLKSFFK